METSILVILLCGTTSENVHKGNWEFVVRVINYIIMRKR